MKKLVVIFMLLSIPALSKSVEDTLQSKFKIGAAISITKTNYTFNNTDYTYQHSFFYQNRMQGSYAVFADIRMSKRIELGFQLSYNDLGWNRNDTAQTIEHPSGLLTRYRYNYIGLSISSGYKFFSGKIWSVYGTAGCGIAFLVHASSKTTGDGKVYVNQAPLLAPQKQVVSISIGVKNNFQLRPHWGIGIAISGLQHLSKTEPVITVKTGVTGVVSLSLFHFLKNYS
jgi:hypothetical protein